MDEQSTTINGNVQPIGDEISKETVNYDKYIATVAIEIGTAFSGYVFSFAIEPDYIYTGTFDGVLPDDREPTALLLNPDDSFSAFGVAAEDAYILLSLTKENDKYKFFKKFSFCPPENDCIYISDISGKRVEACTVYAHSIRYLKSKVLSAIKPEDNFSSSDIPIRWILTVPDESKIFKEMLIKAASDAGIKADDLSLIGEKGAILCYCESFMEDKFVVLDFGEGKAEIYTNDNHFKKSNRFPVKSVETNFCNLLRKTIGEDNWESFIKLHADDYIELMKKLDERKRIFDSNTDNVYIQLPSSLLEYVKSNVVDQPMVVQNSNLILTQKDMSDLFEQSLQNVVGLLNCIEGIDCLVLFGGVCECRYVREVIVKYTNLKFKRIILAPSPRLGLLKGAAILEMTKLKAFSKQKHGYI